MIRSIPARLTQPSLASLAALITMTTLTMLATLPAMAQVRVDKRRPAPVAGELSIDNDFGSVVIRAWENAEVLVRGTLAPGAEGLDFDGDDEGIYAGVDVPRSWFHVSGDDSAYGSHLEVFAPSGSSVSVDSVNADITVEGFSGEIDIDTTNGNVVIRGPAREVDVETMTGEVDVAVEGAPMEIESISGMVRLSGANDELRVETVSAPVEVVGTGLSSVQIQTTTGAVTLRGSLAERGGVEIETFSGLVSLMLPADVRARFDLQSFSGEIRSSLGAGTPDAGERFSPYSRQRFSTGLDGFKVYVNTHDGDIVLEVE